MNKSLVVKEVNFDGAQLMAAQDPNTEKIYVVVSYICNGIGLTEGQRDRQVKNIQNDIVLKQGNKKLPVKFDGQVREVLCIDLEFLPLWLAKIEITPKMQEEQPCIADKLVEYQLKAKDVLAREFLPKAKAENPEKIKRNEIYEKNVRNRAAKLWLDLAKQSTTETYKNIMLSYATKELSGEYIIPLPTSERKTYSATEIGQMFGKSPNLIGRLANEYNLKTDEYGQLYHDKSRYSNKEVDSFRYRCICRNY